MERSVYNLNTKMVIKFFLKEFDYEILVPKIYKKSIAGCFNFLPLNETKTEKPEVGLCHQHFLLTLKLLFRVFMKC